MQERIDPPFSSGIHALQFVLLLAGLLALPLVEFAFGVPSRSDAYLAAPRRGGPFTFMEHEIFEQRGTIDLLFLGSSYMWAGIDTRYVQRGLSTAFGRPATVLTFGSNWRGEDALYVELHDLLEHRRVRAVVVSMPTPEQTLATPHPFASYFMPLGQADIAEATLPWRARLAIYGMQVLGAPRDLLSVVRPNQRRDLDSADERTARDLGADLADLGYHGAPFQRWDPPPPTVAAEAMMWLGEPDARFRVTNQPLNAYQLHFERGIASMLEAHGTTLIVLHIPTFSERGSTTVDERDRWARVLGIDAPLVGIPPSELFQGMPDTSVRALYYDEHLNSNGARFFTETITPALLAVYSRYVH